MKISYDPKYNIAYILFRDKRSKVKTLPISDEVNIDISPDGKIYGIELLNADKQLKVTKNNRFAITDETTGKTIQMPLAV